MKLINKVFAISGILALMMVALQMPAQTPITAADSGCKLYNILGGVFECCPNKPCTRVA